MIKSTRDVADLPPIENGQPKSVEYIKTDRSSFMFSKLTRNLALSALMLIGIVSVRNAQLPSGETLLTAAQNLIIDDSWDETLGRINFVGNFLPKTMAVFLETGEQYQLAAPCSGLLAHAWSEGEPYLGYDTQADTVWAMADGQVMGLAHGLEEEIILRIRQQDGLETFYYNLGSTSLQEGDSVSCGQAVGTILTGKEAMIEVRKEGIPVDPTPWIQTIKQAKQP